MRTEDFRKWLQTKAYNKKPISDCISRCRQVERLGQLDLDEEFKKDKGENICSILKYGCADERNQREAPGGFAFNPGITLRFRSNDLRAALKKYIAFCEESQPK